MRKEYTFVLIKPDAVAANLIGQILSIYEQAGLSIRAMKMHCLSRTDITQLYQKHTQKSFFEEIVTYLQSAPVMAIILSGQNAIQLTRTLNGATSPEEAAIGSIRQQFAKNKQENAVHAADDMMAALFESSLFFSAHELAALNKPTTQTHYYAL